MKLAEGPQPASELYPIAAGLLHHDTTTSFHVAYLKAAGWIEVARGGWKGNTYSLTDEGRRIMEPVKWFVARME